jgi:hypothetical protein
VGVHIIGEDACELVHYGMSLVQTKSTIFQGEMMRILTR